MDRRSIPPGVESAAWHLVLDAATVQVVEGLREKAVGSLLLRGPAIASWLYDEKSERLYTDVDLLVDQSATGVAASVLRRLGFERFDFGGEQLVEIHSENWFRASDRVSVDLHHTLKGVRVSSDLLWLALKNPTEAVSLNGTAVQVPSAPARAMVVCLHAAQHGRGTERTLEDLSRALARCSKEVWRASARLARDVDALDAFGAGLRMLPQGEELASELGLAPTSSVGVQLRADMAPPEARAWELVFSAKGAVAKVRMFLRILFPDPTYVRTRYGLSLGMSALARGYLRHLGYVLRNAPSGFVTWRETRKRLRRKR